MAENILPDSFEDETTMQRYWDTFRRSEYFEPEKALVAAILEDAIQEYRTYREADDSSGRKKFLEVEQWIMREDNGWIFSFEKVCQFLGLDPRYVREELRRQLETQEKTGSDEGKRAA